PREQGQVVEQVIAGGAGAKAGLLASDVLLELDGKPVPRDRGRFLRFLNTMPTNKAVDAVVLRKGVKKTVKGLSLPAATAAPAANPFGFAMPRLAPPFGGRAGLPKGPRGFA